MSMLLRYHIAPFAANRANPRRPSCMMLGFPSDTRERFRLLRAALYLITAHVMALTDAFGHRVRDVHESWLFIPHLSPSLSAAQ